MTDQTRKPTAEEQAVFDDAIKDVPENERISTVAVAHHGRAAMIAIREILRKNGVDVPTLEQIAETYEEELRMISAAGLVAGAGFALEELGNAQRETLSSPLLALGEILSPSSNTILRSAFTRDFETLRSIAKSVMEHSSAMCRAYSESQGLDFGTSEPLPAQDTAE